MSATPAALISRSKTFDLGPARQSWVGGDAFQSRFFDAFSTTLPIGEKFFIDSLRRCQDAIRDPALREEVRVFIQQEAAHAREHRRWNERLSQEGHDLRPLDDSQRRVAARALGMKSPLVPLGISVAMEHITAIMGAAVLRGELLEGADPASLALWKWHAAEEIEHKAVAFDVYQHLGGGPWLRRALMAWGGTLIFARVGVRTLRMLARDGQLFEAGTWRSAARFFFGRRGLVRTLGSRFADFFKRDFHPWDVDDYSLVEQWDQAHGAAPRASAKPTRRWAAPATPHRTGKIFEILAEIGESTLLEGEVWRTSTATRILKAQGDHREFDGYGALCTMFDENNVKYVPPPPRRERTPPNVLLRIVAVIAVLMKKMKLGGLKWTVQNPSWKPGMPATSRARAARALTLDDTERVRAAAKREGVSVNSYLLHALNRAVTPRVAQTNGSAHWGMPVNMRGPVRVDPPYGNTSSIVSVEIPDGASARTVHGVVSRVFARRLDWGKWDQTNLMLRLGEAAARRKVREYYENNAHAARLGVFSNVGVWSGELPDDAALLAFGTAMRVDPIFATTITLNGRLGLAISAHPSLTESAEEVDRWVAAWLDALLPEGSRDAFARPVAADSN